MELARGLGPKRVLLIGGGAFTLPSALLQDLPAVLLDVIELDSMLLDIARRYFGLKSDRRLRVFIGDGMRYLANTALCYDLILVDAYRHASVPESFRTAAAAQNYKRHLERGGVAAMNLITPYSGAHSSALKQQLTAAKTAFQKVCVFPANGSLPSRMTQNLVLTYQNDAHDLQQYLRYPALAGLSSSM
jgi:spermidine synthase